MVYTLRFFSLQNAVCFIILTYLVPVFFTFYIQGVLKLKNISGAKRITLISIGVQTLFGTIKYAAWLKESVIRQAVFTRNFKPIGWRRKNCRKFSCCTVTRRCVAHRCYGTRNQPDFIYSERDMTELRVTCLMSGGTGGSWFVTDEWSKEFYSNR